MAKRGPKPKRTSVTWSADVAYAVGLITTDGYLGKRGYIDLTSKDIEQLENFKKCLNLGCKVSYKTSGTSDVKYPRIQFRDITLHTFLVEEVGLTSNKTKTLAQLNIPGEYYFDFLRGHHDGDGNFYGYWDKRWKNSFMYYLVFNAYSKKHLLWIQKNLEEMIGVSGHLNKASHERAIYQLKYAKAESLKILPKMYPSNKAVCLSRKRLKIEKALSIVGESLERLNS